MEVCALVDRLKLACHHDAYQRTQMPVGAQHFFITDAKSDPYVKFTCLEPMLPPKRKYKTTVKVGTLNPTWTSDELPLFDTVLGTMSLLQTRCVQMHLFDSDLMSANDYLGSASVSLGEHTWHLLAACNCYVRIPLCVCVYRSVVPRCSCQILSRITDNP
eukprot:TRINITY_DN11674_c3_g1_i2.p2 TRINITY_DN11674_c3_g1~~TRINITY_DN11674_c3_g1_i2.p2  ORF type:complete len:160 (+),score=22.72 TRINITY_DN11674_c3_g1_i2:1407-1886(+)